MISINKKTFQRKATPGTLKRIIAWAATKTGVTEAHYKPYNTGWKQIRLFLYDIMMEVS